MFITYTDDDGNPQMWEFDPHKVRASQAEMVEKRFGQPWDVFLQELMKGSMLARRVLLWHLITRTHHTLNFKDTPDFYADQVKVELARAELQQMRDQAGAASGLSDEDRALYLATLDDEIEKAPTGVDEGKAPSEPVDNATG